ncbi:MAG: leucine-rich repeat protein [Oscillospiraceae bacterium]|nr:leucine-rich repeat protein [Oscillospiraceae bacterium]
MKHRMKRCLAFLLCLVMLCTLLPELSARAEEIELIPVGEEPGEEIVIVGEEGPAEETEAVGNGDGVTKYRALLIGQTYEGVEDINKLYGDRSVEMMEQLLENVKGANGGSIEVMSMIDADYYGFYDGIQTAFMGADEDDVSIFYYNGHGVVTEEKDDYAGALVTMEYDYTIVRMTLETLAAWLNKVPGKVVVILDSCGAGACITNSGANPARFGELAVQTFAEQDGAVSNMGEMLTSKYYVLAAAPYDESSWALSGIGGEMTIALTEGAGGRMPADTNGDGKASLQELYKYIDDQVWENQTTCVYPTNSSFKLFSRTGKPWVTTQPKRYTCILALTSVSFHVEAEDADAYQWYYRTSPSGSWHKCTASSATTTMLNYNFVSLGHDGYQYRCKISNDVGYVYTRTATLFVQQTPVIKSDPYDLTISTGGTARFTVEAVDAESYQWYWRPNSEANWQKCTVSTAQKPTLVYTNLTASKDGYQYYCKVSNSYGDSDSLAATLTVVETPVITKQPKKMRIAAGETLSISLTADNATDYQWYWRKNSSASWSECTVSTAQKPTLVYINVSTAKNGYQYYCRVSNAKGSVNSDIATVTVRDDIKPVITAQPQNTTITSGDTLRFTVEASYATGYQWYWRKNSSASWSECTVSTAQKTTLVYINVGTAKNGYQYRCKVSNGYGYVYTNTVTLTVKAGAKPTITTQPTDPTIIAGDTLRITVGASNATGYQWYWRKDSSASWSESTVSTAQKPTLVYTNISAAKNGYQYRCKVSNSYGYVYTDTVTLTVRADARPMITTQPLSYVASSGATIYFKVKAIDADSYQWYYRTGPSGSWNKSTLTGCTTEKLTVKATLLRHGYQYRCKVTNAAGSVYSDAATLSYSPNHGGENIYWKLSSSGLLTIGGTGEMDDLLEGHVYVDLEGNDHSDRINRISIGSGVTRIGMRAFLYFTNLESVTMTDGVTSIGSYAFFGCDRLKKLTIPSSVTTIYQYAFSACDALTEIVVDEGNPNFTSKDGVLFNKNKTALICCPGGKTGSYTIPSGVTRLCDGAFQGCEGLTKITIPVGVIEIGDSAIYGCTGLTGMTIPDGVTSIGEDAFFYCTNLKSVTIPVSVTRIGAWAFFFCDSLTDVYYKGSQTQWNKIEIGTDNDPLRCADIHYNA